MDAKEHEWGTAEYAEYAEKEGKDEGQTTNAGFVVWRTVLAVTAHCYTRGDTLRY